MLCLGSFSGSLARKLGLTLNIYPAKGYSITVPVKSEAAAFNVSLTDDEYKLVYSRLGDRIRVAGTAELSGSNRPLNLTRRRTIVRRPPSVTPPAGPSARAQLRDGRVIYSHLHLPDATTGAPSGTSAVINNQRSAK